MPVLVVAFLLSLAVPYIAGDPVQANAATEYVDRIASMAEEENPGNLNDLLQDLKIRTEMLSTSGFSWECTVNFTSPVVFCDHHVAEIPNPPPEFFTSA